jgi:hypothetical protein
LIKPKQTLEQFSAAENKHALFIERELPNNLSGVMGALLLTHLFAVTLEHHSLELKFPTGP